jgi:hypothetical protein
MTKQDDSEDWVEVAETGNEELASLIAGLLQSEGIPVEVEGPATHPWPETIGALGTSRVTVPPERAAEAREVIRRAEKDSKSRETEAVTPGSDEPDEE